SGPKVAPSRRIRQIQGSASSVRLKHRANQDCGPKHELITHVASLRIGSPVHYEWPLDGVVLVGDAPSERIDVGHEAIPELVVVDQDRFNFIVSPKLIS